MTDDERSLLIDTANALIARRPRSAEELRRSLTKAASRHTIAPVEQSVEQIIIYLEQHGFIDDVEFATWWINQRTTFRPRSKKRLQQELRQKGVQPHDIATSLDTFDEYSACKTLAEKKNNLPLKKCQSYLLRQGFPWDIVSEICEPSTW